MTAEVCDFCFKPTVDEEENRNIQYAKLPLLRAGKEDGNSIIICLSCIYKLRTLAETVRGN